MIKLKVKNQPKKHPFCLYCGASLVDPKTGRKISKTAFCSDKPEHRSLWRKKYKADWFQKNKERLRVRLQYNRQKAKAREIHAQEAERIVPTSITTNQTQINEENNNLNHISGLPGSVLAEPSSPRPNQDATGGGVSAEGSGTSRF